MPASSTYPERPKLHQNSRCPAVVKSHFPPKCQTQGFPQTTMNSLYPGCTVQSCSQSVNAKPCLLVWLVSLTFILQSLRNSGSRWRPYYRKLRLKLLACRPENTKTSLTKQIKKSKSCSKRNTPVTIICFQNLMIKLPRLHTRLPAVHSRLSLGPCRMIGGQDLPRGHDSMLTWVTCAPSTRH